MRKGNGFIKEFLPHFFEEMRVNQIEFCVIKNYANLPESLDGEDIDILIDSKNIEKVKSLLDKLKTKLCIDAISFNRLGNVNTYKISKYINCSQPVLYIDFLTGIEWYGLPIMSNKDIFTDKIKYKTFYVASPVHEILISWLVPFMFGGEIKSRYLNYFLDVYKSEKKQVEAELEKTFPKSLAGKVVNRLDYGDLNICDLRSRMRLSLLVSGLIKFKFEPLKNLLRLSYDKLVNLSSSKH